MSPMACRLSPEDSVRRLKVNGNKDTLTYTSFRLETGDSFEYWSDFEATQYWQRFAVDINGSWFCCSAG